MRHPRQPTAVKGETSIIEQVPESPDCNCFRYNCRRDCRRVRTAGTQPAHRADIDSACMDRTAGLERKLYKPFERLWNALSETVNRFDTNCLYRYSNNQPLTMQSSKRQQTIRQIFSLDCSLIGGRFRGSYFRGITERQCSVAVLYTIRAEKQTKRANSGLTQTSGQGIKHKNVKVSDAGGKMRARYSKPL